MNKLAASFLVVASFGCATPSIDTSPEAAAAVREQSLGDFPYHPIAYHIDLSILAYQLYSQSHVWPFDPYYEDLADPESRRDAWARG